jgi:hypothetical protein
MKREFIGLILQAHPLDAFPFLDAILEKLWTGSIMRNEMP